MSAFIAWPMLLPTVDRSAAMLAGADDRYPADLGDVDPLSAVAWARGTKSSDSIGAVCVSPVSFSAEAPEPDEPASSGDRRIDGSSPKSAVKSSSFAAVSPARVSVPINAATCDSVGESEPVSSGHDRTTGPVAPWGLASIAARATDDSTS
jgi:hypothetical protein